MLSDDAEEAREADISRGSGVCEDCIETSMSVTSSVESVGGSRVAEDEAEEVFRFPGLECFAAAAEMGSINR